MDPYQKLILSRRAFIGDLNLRSVSILEIGPLDVPTFTKLEARVDYMDWFTTDELRAKYPERNNAKGRKIVNVDYAIKGQDFSSYIPDRYNVVIANHVIEHAPDMISWLQNAQKLLRPDGFIFLSIPDKNFTFDRVKPLTTTGSLLRNYHNKLAAPEVYSVFEHLYYHRPIKAADVWNNTYKGHLDRKRCSVKEAWDHANRQVRRHGYVDVHCNILTLTAFQDIVRDLSDLGLLSLSLARATDTTYPDNEFRVALSRSQTATT